MKSTTFAFAAFAGYAAAAVAPTYGNSTSTGSAASCQAKFDDCRSVKDPQNPPNNAQCASEYASCLGYNPFTSSATSSAPATYNTGSTASCQAKYDDCRSVKDPQNPPNNAQCASEFSSCLGYNPFASNGTNTVTAGSNPGAYVTQVVTALTTYCPSATTLTYNSKTYTVTEPTTLTITDCPCKHTTPVASLPQDKTVTAVVSSFTTVCPSPTVITTKKKTYTVTSATTLTITHCPGGCTITTPVSQVPCPTTTPAKSASAPPSYKPSGSQPPKGSMPPVTVTKVISSYTTYCPSATTFTKQGSTYSVSSATTLTIPVKSTYVSQPVASQPPKGSASVPPQAPSQSVGVPPVAPAPSQPAQQPSQSVGVPPSQSAPVATSQAPAPSQSVGGGRPITQISDGQIQAPPATGAAQPSRASGSASPSGTAPAQYTGAADKVMAGGSAFAAALAAALML